MAKVEKFAGYANDFGKSRISNEIIKEWIPVFESYPNLTDIPVYAWGRYYKYECAGSPFEIYSEILDISNALGLMRFKKILPATYEKIQWDIIKEIDETHNIRGGKIWTGEWGGYLPDRGEVVKAFRFDDRGGRCLIVHKNEDKTFEVRDIRCDSPE